MHIEKKLTVLAPRQVVWDYITEPDNYTKFMSGMTRWDVEGETRTGPGARYNMRMKVGTAYAGGLVEIVEFDEGRELAWTGVKGVDQRGRFRLRARTPVATQVTFRFGYQIPGGIMAYLAEKVAKRTVDANIDRSMDNLKAAVEAQAAGWASH